jgi:hypothetical protein
MLIFLGGASMFYDNYYFVNDVKRRIYENYPSVNINVVRDEDDEYFFSINNRGLYYSDDFQLFLMKLKKDVLWKNNIYNIFFSLDEAVNNISSITFSNNISVSGILNWKANGASAMKIGNGIPCGYQLMAA